jgi:hypothetical protein
VQCAVIFGIFANLWRFLGSSRSSSGHLRHSPGLGGRLALRNAILFVIFGEACHLGAFLGWNLSSST